MTSKKVSAAKRLKRRQASSTRVKKLTNLRHYKIAEKKQESIFYYIALKIESRFNKNESLLLNIMKDNFNNQNGGCDILLLMIALLLR